MGERLVEQLDVVFGRALLRAEDPGGALGAGHRGGHVGEQDELHGAGVGVEPGGVHGLDGAEPAAALGHRQAAAVEEACTEGDEDAAAAVDGAGAAQGEHHTLRAAGARVGDEHAGAVGVAGQRHGPVGHRGQAGGGGDVDVGGGRGGVVDVSSLGQPAGGVGGGQDDGLAGEAGGGALAAVGHGGQGDLGVGEHLAHAGTDELGGGVGVEGALEGVGGNDDPGVLGCAFFHVPIVTHRAL